MFLFGSVFLPKSSLKNNIKKDTLPYMWITLISAALAAISIEGLRKAETITTPFSSMNSNSLSPLRKKLIKLHPFLSYYSQGEYIFSQMRQ